MSAIDELLGNQGMQEVTLALTRLGAANNRLQRIVASSGVDFQTCLADRSQIGREFNDVLTEAENALHDYKVVAFRYILPIVSKELRTCLDQFDLTDELRKYLGDLNLVLNEHHVEQMEILEGFHLEVLGLPHQ